MGFAAQDALQQGHWEEAFALYQQALDGDPDSTEARDGLRQAGELQLKDQALGEIRRVLAPGGLAYISEPIYGGEFNRLLRMFHDERAVRPAAMLQYLEQFYAEWNGRA